MLTLDLKDVIDREKKRQQDYQKLLQIDTEEAGKFHFLFFPTINFYFHFYFYFFFFFEKQIMVTNDQRKKLLCIFLFSYSPSKVLIK